jgi:hypothetical protein
MGSLTFRVSCSLVLPYLSMHRDKEMKNLGSKPETGYKHGEYKVNLSRREKQEWNEAHPEATPLPIHK